MNKKIKKLLSLALTFGLIVSQIVNINANGKNTEPIDDNNTQISVESKSNNNQVKRSSREVQSTPVLNDWISTHTARIGKELIHYIDGVSFENYGKAEHDSTGLHNVMLNVFGWERYDKAAQLEKIVVPHIDIEADYEDNRGKTGGVGIMLAGWTGNFDFQYTKNFMKPETSEDNVAEEETVSTTLEESEEEIVFTRKEIIDAIKKEMIRQGKEVPENDEDIVMPNEYIIYFFPLNEKGERIYWKGINKLDQKAPIEYHYTTKDKPIYENRSYQYFEAYFHWYTTSVNDRTESRTTIKYPYYETSDINITPDKTENLKPGDVVNLDINIKNTSTNIINEYLTGGYDVVKKDEEQKAFDEFHITYDDKKYIVLKPGEEVSLKKTYTIPSGYKGDTIELKPYLYGVYSVKDRITGGGGLYFSLNDKEYDDSVTLHIVKGSTGGGGGGGSVDPGPNPPAPSKTVILASGEKYTDILTATVLGNEKDAPILLSQKDKVDEKTLAEIKRLNAEDIIISGGTDSISDKVVDQLKDYNITRIAGKDRYETAEKIGNEVRNISGNKDGAMLVDGTNFPDVITISSLASQKGVPILLTEPQTLTNSTKDTMASWGVNDVTIGGGYNSVSKDIENNLGVNKVSRFGGVDRYETAELIGNEVRKVSGNKDDMILVDGTNFPDGITINSLASRYKSPIMLTEPEHLNAITANKIKEWSIKNILIGGGYNSVSQEIENNLGISNVERVAGQDRYETAVKISERLSQTNRSLGEN